MPRDVADPAGVAVGDEPVAGRARRPAGRRPCPGATTRPRASTTSRSQSRSTRSSWWLLKSTGTPRGAAVAQQVGHRVDGGRVEPGERLVEDEGRRLVEQGGDDLHPLLVAEAERLDPVARAVGEPEPLEVLGDRRRGPPRSTCPDSAAEVDELVDDLLLGVEAALLGHVAEAAAGRRR